MLIYAVADIHSKLQKIETVKNNINRFKPDVLVIAGDLTQYFNPQPTIEHIAALAISTIIVRGNSDLKKVETMLAPFSNIFTPHLAVKKILGYSFVGLNGTIPIPFRSQISLTEKWSHQIEPLLNRQTVLVAHPPPRGTLDSVLFNLHAGCPKIREVIFAQRPLLYICGHIHESSGTQILGETVVVNCSIGREGEGALIELSENSVHHVEML